MTGDRLVLIVDDDAILREMLVDQLNVGSEFLASAARSIADAHTLLLGGTLRYDAVLLDVALPDGNGRDFCRDLRAAGLKMPIIMLTGSDEEIDVVSGLDAGANDYIAKPFRLAELLARLRAQLRAFDSSDDASVTIGPYQFRPSERCLVLLRDGRRIRLTEKETAILRCLYRVGQKPVARERLLDEVWGFQRDVSTHTLETHIYRLRRKIELDPRRARLLITEGGGYRLDLDMHDRSGPDGARLYPA